MLGPRERSIFSELATAGYYVALRVGFVFPLVEHNALPDGWVQRYTQMGYMLHDPVLRWVHENAGTIRWSAIGLPDSRGILGEAAGHGLRFGLAVSCLGRGRSTGQRSFGVYARHDREFTDDEARRLSLALRALHESSAPPRNLTGAELEALRFVRQGLLLKEIAGELGVSEGAVKQRLRNAKTKLGSKTSSQAVSAAVSFGLI